MLIQTILNSEEKCETKQRLSIRGSNPKEGWQCETAGQAAGSGVELEHKSIKLRWESD